jgi:hypothetical protein
MPYYIKTDRDYVPSYVQTFAGRTYPSDGGTYTTYGDVYTEYNKDKKIVGYLRIQKNYFFLKRFRDYEIVDEKGGLVPAKKGFILFWFFKHTEKV